MRVRLALLLVAVGGATCASAGEAAAASTCRGIERPCFQLKVPLDRSGVVPGTVTLHVERHRARRPSRPPLFFIAGGPGQSATAALRRQTGVDLIGEEARLRDVIVMDLRGTGRSSLLRCGALERSRLRDQAAAAASCAAELGPRRAFYTADDSADDIDAVRRRLGAPKIALHGTSYGTRVALAYARRHPGSVDRMVLDSVVGPEGIDPLYRSSMNAAPRAVRALCAKGRCRSVTRDAAADLTRLAARLERRPMRGWTVDDRGRRRPARIDGFGLFTTLVAGDLDPILRSTVPGTVRSAVRGDAAPLLRAYRHALAAESAPSARPRQFSSAVYAAALCEETRLPWDPAAPPAERRRQAALVVGAQPVGAFGPFGPRTALGSDVLDLCARWPARAAQPAPDAPLPDVPALLLAGGDDLRTPIEDARVVAARLPRSELMVVRGSGHSVIGGDLSGCVGRGVERFLAGRRAGRCSGSRFSRPLPYPPSRFEDLRTPRDLGGRRGRTTTAVAWTLIDGAVGLSGRLLSGLVRPGGVVRLGGLRGGSYVLAVRRRAVLVRDVVIVPGVRVSGWFNFSGDGDRVQARLRVRGAAASEGHLTMRRDRLTGVLGGRRVSIRPGPRQLGVAAGAVAAATASSPRPATPVLRLPPRLR